MSEWQPTRHEQFVQIINRTPAKNPNDLFPGIAPQLISRAYYNTKLHNLPSRNCHYCLRHVGKGRASAAFGSVRDDGRSITCLSCWRRGNR